MKITIWILIVLITLNLIGVALLSQAYFNINDEVINYSGDLKHRVVQDSISNREINEIYHYLQLNQDCWDGVIRKCKPENN